MKTLHLLIPCIIGLFWSCEKENVDQTTTSTSEVPIEITEINPGQALLRVAAEAPLAEMRFDSAYFFTRENNGEIEWFFNAEFGMPGETFFLKFTSEEMVAGDYPVSEFKIREFEDLDPNVSFAGEYNIENTGVFWIGYGYQYFSRA